MTRKLLTLFALALFVTTLSACNTVQGVGEDIQDAGEAISDSAD